MAILWLVLSGAGKMKIILRSDWPLERTRRALMPVSRKIDFVLPKTDLPI